ncbi:MAG: hypothetical protein GXO64_03515 [Candidatus Micrarchaeota archaeon]|nr:hypothetical protein [Candidatus Micrarchaeota archaeon]
MFEYWSIFNAMFVFFVLVGFLIYKVFDKGFISGNEKEGIFACGEKWKEQPMPAGFYKTITDTLMVRRLSDMHTGDVSDYLLWIFAGVAAMIIFFVVFYV